MYSLSAKSQIKFSKFWNFLLVNNYDSLSNGGSPYYMVVLEDRQLSESHNVHTVQKYKTLFICLYLQDNDFIIVSIYVRGRLQLETMQP